MRREFMRAWLSEREFWERRGWRLSVGPFFAQLRAWAWFER